MTRTTHYARTSALPAIAAALALSSTPLFAQEVQPTEPAPVTQTTAPPATDATPATTDTSTATSTADTATPAATTTARTTRTHTVRSVKTATPKPKAATTVTRTTVTRQAAAPAPAPAPTAPPTAQPAAPNSESAVAPVVDLTSSSAAKPATPTHSGMSNTEMLEFGAGALALIALGGIAFSTVRRRREERAWHGDWEAEQAVEHDAAVAAPAAVEVHHDHVVHDEQPAVVAPSAFSWGATAPATQHAERDSEDDRLPGETWVQRAYRGPSANNPSVSLKNRLRRAAFFDKRERDVAAGLAEPVDANAGLPDAMVDEQEREFA
jgi:hypothetical protein